jgi:hypothetical protein
MNASRLSEPGDAPAIPQPKITVHRFQKKAWKDDKNSGYYA